ncbi:ABC transporter permease [bacterium RCC_150]
MATATVNPAARPAVARPGRKLPRGFLGAVGVVGFLSLWELLPRTSLVDARYLPPTSEVFAAFSHLAQRLPFWAAVADTMTIWAIGLLISAILGILTGFAIGSSAFMRRFTRSTIEFLRPIPSVALIPAAVLVFGVGMPPAVLLVVYACFWQILIQVLYGVADKDAVAISTARSFGLARMARIRYVILPTTLPYLFTGLRIAASTALILAITAGLIIGSPGLGREIARAQSSGAVASMLAIVVVAGFIGVVINLMFRGLEKRVLSWHSSVRSEVDA